MRDSCTFRACGTRPRNANGEGRACSGPLCAHGPGGREHTDGVRLKNTVTPTDLRDSKAVRGLRPTTTCRVRSTATGQTARNGSKSEQTCEQRVHVFANKPRNSDKHASKRSRTFSATKQNIVAIQWIGESARPSRIHAACWLTNVATAAAW